MSSESKDVLKALSNSTRRTIMRHISEKGRATYTEIMQVLGLDPSLSGTFNYHLKELNKAGLIKRTNGEYQITNAGMRAIILVDQVAKESKDKVTVDQYGVLSAVLSMNPRKELTLFASQMGIMIGILLTVFSFVTIVLTMALKRTGTESMVSFWLSGIVLFLGFVMTIISTVKMIGILKKLKVGFSVVLFLGSNWFFIRSPNRNRFFQISITIAGVVTCSVFALTFSFVGLVALFSIQWYGLILSAIGFAVLTLFLFISAKRKADRLEAMNGEQ